MVTFTSQKLRTKYFCSSFGTDDKSKNCALNSCKDGTLPVNRLSLTRTCMADIMRPYGKDLRGLSNHGLQGNPLTLRVLHLGRFWGAATERCRHSRSKRGCLICRSFIPEATRLGGTRAAALRGKWHSEKDSERVSERCILWLILQYGSFGRRFNRSLYVTGFGAGFEIALEPSKLQK